LLLTKLSSSGSSLCLGSNTQDASDETDGSASSLYSLLEQNQKQLSQQQEEINTLPQLAQYQQESHSFSHNNHSNRQQMMTAQQPPVVTRSKRRFIFSNIELGCITRIMNNEKKIVQSLPNLDAADN
jgi:hypothetical protein